jgi:hypothetical protein
VGIINDDLMLRVDPEKQDEFLQGKGCRIMDFNPRAKSSKNKSR